MRTAATVQVEPEHWPVQAQLDTLRAFWRAVLSLWLRDASEPCHGGPKCIRCAALEQMIAHPELIETLAGIAFPGEDASAVRAAVIRRFVIDPPAPSKQSPTKGAHRVLRERLQTGTDGGW
jgi:hypothetical protein